MKEIYEYGYVHVMQMLINLECQDNRGQGSNDAISVYTSACIRVILMGNPQTQNSKWPIKVGY